MIRTAAPSRGIHRTTGFVAGDTHSGDAPRDLLWVLREDEGTVTAEEYRRRNTERR